MKNLQQADFFEETLEKKILRMEKWIYRLQKEVWFLKEVWIRTDKSRQKEPSNQKTVQIEMFG